jgi:hypothetical protein
MIFDEAHNREIPLLLNKHKPVLDRPITKRDREKIEMMCRAWWDRMVKAWEKAHLYNGYLNSRARLTPEEKEW